MNNATVQYVQWLRQQARRQSRVVLLEDALLSNRFWSYAWYRLRYFSLRLLADSGVHLVRVLLLFSIFSQSEFNTILFFYVGSALATSFWWGALEAMRGRIRELHRLGRVHLIPREISRWLVFSIQLATMPMGIGVAWVLWRLWAAGDEIGVAHFYVAALLLKLSLSLAVRCYHSGIYAIRRVYRPLPAIVAVELCAFLVTLSLWPLLGVWSFPVAELVAALVVAGLTYRYTHRMYRLAGLDPSRLERMWRLRFPFKRSAKEGLLAGVSNAFISTDSLMVLTLLAAASSRTRHELTLFSLLFVVSPIILAGSEWARLFYFDLKRLEIRLFRNLRKRFERYVLRLAWIVAVVLWVFGSLMVTLAFRTDMGKFYALMLPFFVSGSLLAAFQIQAFSERSYYQLLGTGALLVAGIVAVGLWVADPPIQILLLSAVMVFVALVLGLLRAAEGDIEGRSALWPSEWVTLVDAIPTPVRITAAEVVDLQPYVERRYNATHIQGGAYERRQLVEMTAARLARAGAATLVSPNLLLWYEHGDKASPMAREWLVRQAGGMVNILGETGVQASGSQALDEANGLGLMSSGEPPGGWSQNRPGSIEDVLKEFRKQFPEGIVFDVREATPPQMDHLTSMEKRNIMGDAAAFARDLRNGGRSRYFEATSLSLNGDLRYIFLLGLDVNQRRRFRWQRFLASCHLMPGLEKVGVR